MNGSTAFHLKQIMSAEHLSLTQAAKLIGISPSSMRKVLKDTKMSQAVMFKINRFIDSHQDIVATKPGEMPKAAAQPAATKKAETKPAAKPRTKKATATKAETAKATPTAKQPVKAQATPATKATKQAPKAAAEKKPATKAAKPTNKAQKPAGKAQASTPKPSKPAAKKAASTPATAKTEPKQNRTQFPGNSAHARAIIDAIIKPAAKPQAPATAASEQPAKKRLSRHEQKATKQRFVIHQIDGEPIVPEAVQDAKAKEAKAQAEADKPVVNAKPQAPKSAPKPATAKAATKPEPEKPVVAKPAATRGKAQKQMEARAEELSQAGVGSMDPKPVTNAQKPVAAEKPQAQPKPQATAKPQAPKPAAAEKPQPKPQATAKPQAQPAKPTTPVATAASTKASEPAKPTPAAEKPAAEAPNNTPVPHRAKTPVVQPEIKAQDAHPLLHKRSQTLQLFIDESFVHGNDYQRNMFIGVTMIDQDNSHALDQFSNTLYPFGWQPGDEVKARGKSHDQIAAMLTQAHSNQAENFVVFSPQSDTGNFALGFGVLYPYIATILRVLKQLDTLPAKVRIALDRRNEIEDEQLAVAARMLNAYVKAQTGKDVMFMLRTSDSKSTIAIQYSDFSAHAALTFTTAQLAECGITRLPDLGTVVGDQITLFSMIGLQKYMLDDRSVIRQQAGYKNPVLAAAERLLRLANKATGLTDVPDETMTQAKLVINQLLQTLPSAITGAINKMPFQNWYDMMARASALLHYTDESLPEFDLDPDAMQIAQDALNNIANLLASAK